MRLTDRRAVGALAWMMAAIAAAAMPVHAQERDAGASHLFDVGVSVSGAYDSDTSIEPVSSGLGQIQPAGYSTWAIGTLQYLRRFTRVDVQTAASSAIRYFPEVREFRSVSHTGAVGLGFTLPNRYSLQINQVAAYSPPYLYGLFPDLPIAAGEPIAAESNQDYDVDSSSSYASATSIAFSRAMTRRTTIAFSGDYSVTKFEDPGPDSLLDDTDVTTYSFGPRFTRSLTRNSSMSVGYLYRGGGYGYATEAITKEHAFDGTYSISRRLSPTRTMTVSVRGGGSVVEVPEELAEFDIGGRQYQANAEASLSYPVMRTGQLRGSFTRGLQFVAGLTHPVFVSGYTGEFNTGVIRRMEFLARFAKSTGQSAFTQDNLLDTYTGHLRLSYQLMRNLSAYGEYLQYFYDTRGEGDAVPVIPIAPGIPADLKRHGGRVGVLWFVPVLRR